jgi:ribonuclease PH
VALALALQRLIDQELAPPGVLLSPVASVSVGVVGGEPLLDLDYSEDSQAEVDVNVVMNARGEFIELQGTAEGRPFSRPHLERMLELAELGIGQLLAAQGAALDGQV